MFFLLSPPQASLSFMLLPLLSKKWLIFAKSYYYRSMRDPMYDTAAYSLWAANTPYITQEIPGTFH